MELLKKNKHVKHVSNKSISYTLEFKKLFISEYGIKSATIIFEEAGLPTLILDGDGCDRSHGGEGQTSTRLGAFLEMLGDFAHE